MKIRNNEEVVKTLKSRQNLLMRVQDYERDIVKYLLAEGRVDLFSVKWSKITQEFSEYEVARDKKITIQGV